MSKRWLDDDGTLLHGKYAADLIEDVARLDPGYLRWLVDTVENLDEGDRDVINSTLAYRNRNNSKGR